MTDEEYLKKYLKTNELAQGLKRLKKGQPVQYIIGNVNFYGNTIDVTKDTLIPRFETELLVSKTIDYIKSYFKKKVSIIDLGTGSGNIAITLAQKIPSEVTAVDISPKALNIARKNAKKNGVKIKFYQNDMLNNITEKFDVIISNPPYISYDEKVEDIVKNNEPSIALYAKNNGLEFYEKILSKAKNNINEKALIAFEIGKDQGANVKNIALKYFPNSKIIIEKDYPGKDRFVFIFI